MTAAKPEQDLEGLRQQLMHLPVKTYLQGEEIIVQLGTLISYGDNWNDIMRLVQAEVALAVDRASMKIELQLLRDSGVTLPTKLIGEEMKWRQGYKAGMADLAAAIKAELHPPQQPPTGGGSNNEQ